MMVMKEVRGKIIVTGKVTEVGYRLFVLNKLISLGLKGFPYNISESEVEIRLKGPPQQIKKLHSILLSEAPEGAKPKSVSAFKADESILIPEQASSTALFQCEQLGKGVAVINSLDNNIKSFHSNTKKNFSELGSNIKSFHSDTKKNFIELGEKYHTISQDLHEMNKNLKYIVYIFVAALIVWAALNILSFLKA